MLTISGRLNTVVGLMGCCALTSTAMGSTRRFKMQLIVELDDEIIMKFADEHIRGLLRYREYGSQNKCVEYIQQQCSQAMTQFLRDIHWDVLLKSIFDEQITLVTTEIAKKVLEPKVRKIVREMKERGEV
jgi:hypothetical protein